MSTPCHSQTDDDGYVMPMTALLMVPLMIFAALAVDIGSWFVRADQAQRAADAAALAGTVWLPDFTKASEVARDVAARTGFRDPAWVAANGGTANATVESPGITTDGGLQIDITVDTPSYFGAVVLDKISIKRTAIAAVTAPVRMGNPTNGLGTGNLDSSTGAEIMEVFDQLHSEGNTIVLVTHEDNVASHAHREIRLFDGQIASDSFRSEAA